MNEELPRKHGVTATKRGGRAAVRPRSHRSGSGISDPAWPRRQVRAVRLQTNGRRSVSCIADGRRSPPCRQVTNVIATERHAGERPPFARPLNVFKLQRHTRNDHRPAPDRDPLASWPPGYFRRTARVHSRPESRLHLSAWMTTAVRSLAGRAAQLSAAAKATSRSNFGRGRCRGNLGQPGVRLRDGHTGLAQGELAFFRDKPERFAGII